MTLDLGVGACLALAALVALSLSRFSADTKSSSLPVYGPWYLPRFVRGILALYRLGKDEDAFMLGLRRDYGVAVWIPWPMRQTIVVGTEAIEKVYRAPAKSLSFHPIRREMQGTAFGAAYWNDKSIMDDQMFPAHARGMSKNRLTEPLRRFIGSLRDKVERISEQIDASSDGQTTLDLTRWVTEAFYDATLTGFFGPQVLDARGTTREEMYQALETYDHAFPIIASGLIPPALVERIPDVKEARKAQHVLAATFADWTREGFPGLDEGLTRDLAQIVLDNGLGDYEAGKLVVADFWASMANSPSIAVRLLIILLQAPADLRADLQREIDAAMSVADRNAQDEETMTFAHLAQSLPLLGSCISETMRLETSTLSIRVVEQDIVLTSDAADTVQRTVVVPENTRLVCATRVHHLNNTVWDGNASEWDGRRFLDGYPPGDGGASAQEKGDATWRSKRANSVYGFGGGISRCEGQHIATAELKALIALFLHHYEADIVVHNDKEAEKAVFLPIKYAGTARQGWRPKPRDGRVGMGAYQMPREARIDMKVRRRTREAI